MKTKLSPGNFGAALVLVLMVLVFCGCMVAGWLAVHSSQTAYVETLDESSMRRVAYHNALAVIREYLLESVVGGTSSAGIPDGVDLPGGWGSAIIPSTAFTPLEVDGKALGWNQFNWGSGEGYSAPLVATMTLTAGMNEGVAARLQGEEAPLISENRLFEIKSRSPVLSGDLFIVNNPGNSSSVSVTGSIDVNGRAILWKPFSPNTYSMTMDSFTVRDAPTSSLTGLFSNFPFPPVTTGSSGGTTLYDGRLNVVSSSINSLTQKALTESLYQIVTGKLSLNLGNIVCNALGQVRIDLGDPSLENVIINGNTSTLILDGQETAEEFAEAGNYRAVLIVLDQPPLSLFNIYNLSSVVLNHRNNRKVVLAIKKANGTTVTISAPNAATGPWRGVFVFEQAPTWWSVPSGATLAVTGGIQTNRSVTVNGGAMAINPETDPRLLERLTPRDAWVESYVSAE